MKKEGSVWLLVCPFNTVFCHRCNICVCVCVRACTSVALGVYSFQAWEDILEVCVVWALKWEGFIFGRTHQSPAFSPGLCFHLLCVHAVTLLFSFVCVTVKCYQLFMTKCQRWQDWMDGLCSTENWFCGALTLDQLHFARPALTFVSPLLVRPRSKKSGQSSWWTVLRFLLILNIYLFIVVDIFTELFSFFLFVFLLYNSCTCARPVCSCLKRRCSM